MDRSVTIVKINQVIVNASNGATIPNFTKDLGDFEFDPGAKAVKQGTTTPSGLAVLYTTSNANIVALTAGGTKIVPVGKGTATITATQAGNPAMRLRQDLHGCGDRVQPLPGFLLRIHHVAGREGGERRRLVRDRSRLSVGKRQNSTHFMGRFVLEFQYDGSIRHGQATRLLG